MATAAPVTVMLIGVSVAVFAITTSAGLNTIAMDWGLVPARVVEGGAIWQPVTSIFLHGGLVHLGFNMLALWILGSQLEVIIGRGWYLATFFLSGLAGSALYVFVGMTFGNPYQPAIGASGAIFGLFGAMAVLAWRRRDTAAGRAMWRNIGGLIVLNIMITFTFPGIAWQAHIGGLIAGAAVMAVRKS